MRTDQARLRSAIGRAAAKGAMLALIAVGGQCDDHLLAQSLTSTEKTALTEFDKRAADYIRMVRKSPSGKPIKPSTDAAALEEERSELRGAVQSSRPNAKQGDIFTPQSAVVFKKLLKQTLSGPDGARITASLKHAEPLVPTKLAVNASFPNERGQPMQSVPASLLQNLPKLPKGLEYRVAGKALALRDLDANIVVDFIPDALP